jgi:hypothetical protein
MKRLYFTQNSLKLFWVKSGWGMVDICAWIYLCKKTGREKRLRAEIFSIHVGR